MSTKLPAAATGLDDHVSPMSVLESSRPESPTAYRFEESTASMSRNRAGPVAFWTQLPAPSTVRYTDPPLTTKPVSSLMNVAPAGTSPSCKKEAPGAYTFAPKLWPPSRVAKTAPSSRITHPASEVENATAVMCDAQPTVGSAWKLAPESSDRYMAQGDQI